jgi:hypothetical protein
MMVMVTCKCSEGCVTMFCCSLVVVMTFVVVIENSCMANSTLADIELPSLLPNNVPSGILPHVMYMSHPIRSHFQKGRCYVMISR